MMDVDRDCDDCTGSARRRRGRWMPGSGRGEFNWDGGGALLAAARRLQQGQLLMKSE